MFGFQFFKERYINVFVLTISGDMPKRGVISLLKKMLTAEYILSASRFGDRPNCHTESLLPKEINNLQEIYITHYFNNQSPKEGLRELDFLTTTKKDLEGKFYFIVHDHFRSISENELEMQLKECSIVRLPTPVKTKCEKVLWMDSEGIVYVADPEKPYADVTRKAVYNSITKKSLI